MAPVLKVLPGVITFGGQPGSTWPSAPRTLEAAATRRRLGPGRRRSLGRVRLALVVISGHYVGVTRRDNVTGLAGGYVRQVARPVAGWMPALPVVDGVAAVLLAALAVPGLWLTRHASPGGFRAPDAGAALLALAQTLPLAWRRRRPDLVLVIVAVAQLLSSVADYPPGLALPAFLLAVYSFAVHRVRSSDLWPVAVLAGTLAAEIMLTPRRIGVGDIAGTLVPACVAWIVGDVVRARGRDMRVLRSRARELEQEREAKARAAVAAERARIARELHDIVAHALGVIVMQAGGAGRIVQSNPPAAQEAFGTIERTGRAAFAEMRRLVDVLRIEDGDGLRPQPTLADVPVLVDGLKGERMRVSLTVHGEPRPVPSGVDLSAYRVVQEALTNSLKHAAPTCARVNVCWSDSDLQLEITDTGRTAGNGAPPATADHGGYGLLGMRERVAIFRGDLDCGPVPGGGFRVWARFPLAPAS